MIRSLPRILAVLVNYGDEQINYLQQVVKELKGFSKYDVTVIVNSNMDLSIEGIDKVNVFELDDYQLLPQTCRKVIWENKNEFDIFIYGENDHLFLEKHIDNHIKYSKILPKTRISGLIQFEEDETGKYYPGYHLDFDWDFNSVEIYEDKVFAHFNNVHQATFILTKEQLIKIGKKINFCELVNDFELSVFELIIRKVKRKLGLNIPRHNIYSVKCKVNTDIFKYGGMKKLICISDFEDNLIHHLPNIYINGLKGRQKLRSDFNKMDNAIDELLKI
ncbi:hypothetical protein Lupro_02330 [Lutibacter profundi]|uniref:Glycosyltransferase 2-like domain-containing protein n=1 Tax=Lutibacter profundi TaxID=1622118 RepID=A0A0X8G4Y4_9FLAO|nr:hypothetical protein [Lutibacter profundi]AMC10156.1 hypothetical protein Lupro_02330 [Lutibacter profundi]